jgi:hypothetical protein
VLNGEETVTRHGHWNPIGLTPGNWVDYRYGPEDGVLECMVAEVHADGGLAIANHPFTGCGACQWHFPYGPMDAIEVWNGPWGTDEERALELWRGLLEGGQVHPIVGASDGRGNPGNPLGSPAQTVVRAGALAREEILEGIRRGRSYVAASSAVTLRMTAHAGRERAGLGQRLRVNGRRPAEVRLRVRGVPGGEVTLRSEAGEIARARLTGDDQEVRAMLRGRRAELVRAEVRRPDGTMAALTNPIWLGREPRERPLAMVGTPDGSALELALAPNGYGRYATAFPEGASVDTSRADRARGWPYIQPGPLDAWGGSGDRTFRLRFDLRRPPRGEVRFVAWLLDTPRWAPASATGPSARARSPSRSTAGRSRPWRSSPEATTATTGPTATSTSPASARVRSRWRCPARRSAAGSTRSPSLTPRARGWSTTRWAWSRRRDETDLEGTYSEVYPRIGHDEAGLRRLFRQFSFRAAFPATWRRRRPARSTRAASLATRWCSGHVVERGRSAATVS